MAVMAQAILSSPGQQPASGLKMWLVYLGMLAGAMAVNLVLFGLMPFLLTHNEGKTESDLLPVPVNLIRLQPPEPPVKKTVEKPPPPPKPKAPKPQPPQRSFARLSLPFSVSSRLPPLAGDLSLPVVPAADLGRFDDIFGVGDLDSPLSILVRIPPIYPISAKRRGIEGWVRIRFIVNEDGSVSNLVVAESKPLKLFDDAVIRSVSGWRFKAGTVGGVPVKTQAETVVRFELD